jgi:hypothetical protein
MGHKWPNDLKGRYGASAAWNCAGAAIAVAAAKENACLPGLRG